VTSDPAREAVPKVRARLAFLDVLRGVAIILMIVNHTAHDWIGRDMGWPRYWLVYGSVLLPAPIFLFLVGFCLPIPLRRTPNAALPAFRTAWPRYARRGFRIVLGGLLLNVVVFGPLARALGGEELPWWSGGVLQTIGIAVMVVAAGIWLASRAWGRLVLLALGVAAYAAFALALPALDAWSREHPVAAGIVFRDFPPWPWVGAAFIGLALGWWWLDARASGPAAERRYFGVAALVGGAYAHAYLACAFAWPTTPFFGFPRDLMLNHHWTPGGVTSLLVVGGVALLLAATYWLTEVRGLRLRWLVILGQTALMLYFVHQMIELTLVRQALGVTFHSWAAYWAANVALVAVCVAIGHVWLTIRPRTREIAGRALARVLPRGRRPRVEAGA
jgi:peptidoglycan/LPS O-acetylase OafA/YrhL